MTQRGAGANMSVDIAANAGSCVVQGDHVGSQGLYPVPPHTAVVNEAVTAAHATLPRIDQVVLELQDNTHDSSGGNLARVRVIAGTATSGATLDNRTGAAALPSSCMRLADVLVGAAVTSITTANCRDRRQWARGAYFSANDTSGNATTGSTSFASVNAGTRIECSGVPMRARIAGRTQHSAAGASMVLQPWVDGATAIASSGDVFLASPSAAFEEGWFSLTVDFTPSAGSRLLTWAFSTTAATMTLLRSVGSPLQMGFEEIVRSNAFNS